MSIDIKLGQRWEWTYPNYEYMVEVVTVLFTQKKYECKILQIFGKKLEFNVGECVTLILGDDYHWKYMEGQDKPESYNCGA